MQRHLSGLIFLLMVMAFLPWQLSAAATAEDKNLPGQQRSEINANTTGNPPIECPLRKQGINPHDLKPFAETQQYIDFLERRDRAVWQKPGAVIKELHLSGAEKIADVGAGTGYFTFRIARAVPTTSVAARCALCSISSFNSCCSDLLRFLAAASSLASAGGLLGVY